MKLLLDEMYNPAIAKELRRKFDIDAIAVKENDLLIGLSDSELFEIAQSEKRAVVSENVPDFLLVETNYRADNREHCGLILTSDKSFPRSRPATTGKLVKALATLVDSYRDRQLDATIWLQPVRR